MYIQNLNLIITMPIEGPSSHNARTSPGTILSAKLDIFLVKVMISYNNQ